MHVEPLEKLPRSVREFLSHYAMIVVSILTALALEQVALGLEHRHEGQRAREEIEQEIASNRKGVEESLKTTRQNGDTWSALLKRAVADVRSKESTNESRLAILLESGPLFRDSLPSLKTTAWDAAIADHSVNYLDHELLSRYSDLYASQRLFTQAMWDTLRDSGVRNLSEITQAVYMRKADPAPTIAALNTRLLTIRIVQSQMEQLEVALKDAGAQQASAASAPVSSASAASR